MKTLDNITLLLLPPPNPLKYELYNEWSTYDEYKCR